MAYFKNFVKVCNNYVLYNNAKVLINYIITEFEGKMVPTKVEGAK